MHPSATGCDMLNIYTVSSVRLTDSPKPLKRINGNHHQILFLSLSHTNTYTHIPQVSQKHKNYATEAKLRAARNCKMSEQ